MTKQNPDKLCSECKKFDYDMNRKDGISFDIYVQCDHYDSDPSMVLREYLMKGERNERTIF